MPSRRPQRTAARPAALAAAAALLAAGCQGNGAPGGDAYRTHFVFETRLKTATYYDLQSGVWVLKRRNKYHYDDRGRMVQAERMEPSAGDWALTGHVTVDYDAEDFVRTLTTTRKDADQLLEEQWRFDYGEHGNLVREHRLVRRDGGWQPTMVFELRYDDRNLPYSKIGLQAGVETSRVLFEHDGDGLLATQRSRYLEHGAWLDDFKYRLSHAGGQPTEVVVEHSHLGAWRPATRFSYLTDQQGLFSEIVSHDPSAGGWIEDESYAYSYDGSDPTEIINYRSRGGARVKEQRAVYDNEPLRCVLPQNLARVRWPGIKNRDMLKFFLAFVVFS